MVLCFLFEIQFGKCICKCVVDRFFLLLFQIFLHIFFADTGAFFFTPFLECCQFFFVPANTYKNLTFTFSAELHFLMT